MVGRGTRLFDGFQFLIGKLKTGGRKWAGSKGSCWFQFLIGKLKTPVNNQAAQEAIKFQFLIGKLKTRGGISD